MYDKIREVTFKINNYCNLDCTYCFQRYDEKEKHEGFTSFEALLEFMKKLPLDEHVEFKITGGESSLFTEEIREAYRVLKRLERYKDTKVIFSTISNGTNMKALLSLMDDGILNPDYCKISYDGIYSATRSRLVKRNKKRYTNKYFNEQISLLGQSQYKDRVLVRTAVSPNTIKDLPASLNFILNAGCTKWEYYLLSNYDYSNLESTKLLSSFKEALNDILSIYESKMFTFYNYEVYHYNNHVADKDYRLTNCRHLGRFLYIDNDGSIYPCGFFSPDAYFEDQKYCIGDIYTGFSEDLLKFFAAEYFTKPSCSISEDNGCKCMHCFECPAVSNYNKNHLHQRMGYQCTIRNIENTLFSKCNVALDESHLRKIMTPYDLDMKIDIPNTLPFRGGV